MKRLIWLSNTLAQVRAFPASVQDDVGYALYVAQLGDMHCNAKPLRGLGSGVLEISSNDPSGTYRAVYVVSIADAIYVIHAFQKKSKTGIKTPKSEIDIIQQRLKQLKAR